MPLKSTLMPGRSVSAFDEEIVKTLQLKASEPDAVRSERMQLGIRNEAGDIYRVIGVTGMNAWLDVINDMLELGFVDELAEATDSKHGCDAIFSRRA